MKAFWRRDDHARPPLVGRIAGWAIATLLLSLAVSVAIKVLTNVLLLTAPFLGLAIVYALVIRRRG
jgi:hypothetical protein